MERKGTGDVKDRKEQGDGRHKKRESAKETIMRARLGRERKRREIEK